jgi:hypothetical protein
MTNNGSGVGQNAVMHNTAFQMMWYGLILGLRGTQRWLRIFEQNFRADKWNLCQGYAASRIGGFVK